MNKKFNKIKYLPFLIFLGVVFFSFINTYFKSKAVHFDEYDFVVTKVTHTATGGAIPFKGDVEMDMWQYHFFPKNIVKVGDSIHKGSEQKYLFIFRKGDTEKFILTDSIQPTGMYYWNYKN